MKKSSRALLGLVVIDLFLALGTLWMVLQVKNGSWSSSTVPPEEAIWTMTSTGGAAIGVVTGLLLVVWFVRRRRGE